MAGPEGFEPPNARTKTWCLTAWPRPNILEELYHRLTPLRIHYNLLKSYQAKSRTSLRGMTLCAFSCSDDQMIRADDHYNRNALARCDRCYHALLVR